jgi:alpha-tubulin suppressor-like RCC1 family protein
MLLTAFTTGAQPVITAIAAGGGQDVSGNILGGHSLFIKSDGSLWVMGNNLYGQLGDGTTQNANRPEMIEPSGVTAIAAGRYHSLFIMNGNLWSMGFIVYGQLGDRTTTDHLVPEMITNFVRAISAGGLHSLFIRKPTPSLTQLWGMGYNNDGELGVDGGINQTTPVQIESGTPTSGFVATAISAGGCHSLILRNNGCLWTMGLNNYGQLGNGSFNTSFSPQQVVNDATAIAGGGYHSLIISSDGLFYTGDNNDGQ